MSRTTDLLLSAAAPVIWGTTYIVTTRMLPPGYPVTVATLRALPAGLLLLMVTRQLPPMAWLGRLAVLGALNFALFWAALFIAAYRLPGGVAATLGAIQPLIMLLLARAVFGTPLSPRWTGPMMVARMQGLPPIWAFTAVLSHRPGISI